MLLIHFSMLILMLIILLIIEAFFAAGLSYYNYGCMDQFISNITIACKYTAWFIAWFYALCFIFLLLAFLWQGLHCWLVNQPYLKNKRLVNLSYIKNRRFEEILQEIKTGNNVITPMSKEALNLAKESRWNECNNYWLITKKIQDRLFDFHSEYKLHFVEEGFSLVVNTHDYFILSKRKMT